MHYILPYKKENPRNQSFFGKVPIWTCSNCILSENFLKFRFILLKVLEEKKKINQDWDEKTFGITI